MQPRPCRTRALVMARHVHGDAEQPRQCEGTVAVVLRPHPKSRHERVGKEILRARQSRRGERGYLKTAVACRSKIRKPNRLPDARARPLSSGHRSRLLHAGRTYTDYCFEPRSGSQIKPLEARRLGQRPTKPTFGETGANRREGSRCFVETSACVPKDNRAQMRPTEAERLPATRSTCSPSPGWRSGRSDFLRRERGAPTLASSLRSLSLFLRL